MYILKKQSIQNTLIISSSQNLQTISPPAQMNTSGERDRSREESGSEEDPLTKTSPPGDQNHHSYQSQNFI